MSGVWCIVVAGGSGRRFGSVKQFEHLNGVRVIDRAVATAAAACDGVVAVVPASSSDSDRQIPAATTVVEGGGSRAESVRSGLAAVPDDVDVVLVHDGARPLASATLFHAVIDRVRAGSTAVVPAVEVTDTIRSISTGVLDREQLRAVQTPQGFDARILRRAHASGADATDDAGLVELLGETIVMIPGEVANLKLTSAQDLLIASLLDTSSGPP